MGNTRDPLLEITTKEEVDKLFLVNLKMDETESKNLASKYPEKVNELQELHKKWAAEVRKEMNK